MVMERPSRCIRWLGLALVPHCYCLLVHSALLLSESHWTDRYEMSQCDTAINYFHTSDIIFICLFLAQYEKAQILH